MAECAQVELLTHRRSVVRTEDKAAVAKTNRTTYSIGPILDRVSAVLWLERRRTALKLKYVAGLVHTCPCFVQANTLLRKTLHERPGQTNQPVENSFFLRVLNP